MYYNLGNGRAVSEEAAVPQEVYMRLRIRNWLRSFLRTEAKTDSSTEGYLREFPWLRQLIPLGRQVKSWFDSNGISVIKLDEKSDSVLKAESRGVFSFGLDHEMYYFVSKSGEILGYTKTFPRSEKVMKTFHRLQQKADETRYLVRVYVGGSSEGPTLATITIYKFPPDTTPVVYREEYKRREWAKSVLESRRAQEEARQLIS